ncbi:MAG: glycosyltransferase [Mycobacterium sp.]|nr:glycosyltransferase [Mycobacterium sp.]
MKIAMVSAHASPLAALGGVDFGGQNVHVAELSAAMARRGHEVTVYTRRDKPYGPECVRTQQGYSVVHVPAGPPAPLPKDETLEHMGIFASYLAKKWRTRRPDIAHAHFWISGVATHLAARTCGVPTVQTFHALDTSPGARLKLEPLVARNASWVAATCTDEVFELTRMGRSRTRISLVPCGVDLDRFNTDGPVAKRGSAHRIVSVGRMLPRKGFDTMIEAMASIPDAELVIVGGPVAGPLDADPEVGRLRFLAAEIGVGNRVSFTGSVDHQDMPAILRSADVVACTPWYEPRGMVALEAMGCGVPVVASAVGSMLDMVIHDVTGRLVAPRRPRECAESVSTILRDSFRRRSLGLAGRDRACARYSWDRVAADTLRTYARIANTPSALATAVLKSG